MAAVWFAIGLAVALIALWDAFETIVLPRTVQRRFRLTRFVIRGSWLTWLGVSRLPMSSGYRDSFIATYGPLLLLFLIVCWASSLILGLGLMLHGLALNSDGQSLTDSIYLSGSAFFTLGLGDVTPVNHACRVLIVIEAGTGFGFLAMVIGYLPIFYQAFSRREVAISLLDARAGSPPTAIEMLRRNGERVAGPMLAEWEGWASELLESHLSYPILAFFRSQHEKQSWLSALVVILDVSALLMVGLGEMPAHQARLSFAIGRHALVDLTQIFYGSPEGIVPPRLSHEGFVALAERLADHGFAFSDTAEAEERLARLRQAYEPMANALAKRLLIELPPWLPSPHSEDDWQSSPWDTLPGF